MTQRIYMVNDSKMEVGQRSPLVGATLYLLLFLLLLTAGPVFAAGGALQRAVPDPQAKDQVPVASVTDGNGNVYVTGWRVTGGVDCDWWTTRFNADGTVGWHAEYAPSTGADRTAAITLDSQNNVIVTGTVSIGASTAIHTIKYRGDTGAAMWERRFAGSSQDIATSIAVDKLDNVYVAGYTRNTNGLKRFLVVKYSHSDNPEQDGVQLWKVVHEKEGEETCTEEARSIAADQNGVAVTGFSGPGADFDMLTVYYSTDGIQLWQKRHGSAAAPPTADQGKHVRLDQAGDVVVTGYTVNSPGKTIYTAKYRRVDGTLAWEASYPSSQDNEPTALVVDAAGNVYVAATIWTDTGSNDFYVVKYARDPASVTTANKLWDALLDSGAGDVDIAAPTGIVVDPAGGDVYVTGYTEAAGKTGFQTVRYKGDSGAELWHVDYAAGLNQRPVGIGLFPGGDVLVAGWTESAETGLDYIVVKHQAGGVNRPTGLVAQTTTASSITLSWVPNSTNHTGFNIYRWNPPNSTWDKVGTAGASPYIDSAGIAADTRYDYYVTASIVSQPGDVLLDESLPSNQAYAVTTVMNPVVPTSSTTFDSDEHREETAASIAVGPDNNPVVTGSSMSDIGGYDYLTLKFEAQAMTPVWKDIYNGDTNGTDEARVVAVDRAGDVIVSGYSELDNGSTGSSGQIFTLKYKGTGNGDQTTSRLWRAQYKGTPRIDDRAEAVATAVDGSNNVAVAGRARNSDGNYDLYVVKYGPNPNLDMYGNNNPPQSWQAQPFDRGGNDQPSAVAFDPAGNIFVAGFTERRDAGTVAAASPTTITDAGKNWAENSWKFATLTITSGLNTGETRRIIQHSATELTVDRAFSYTVLAGATYAISDYDWFAAKYDGATGARIWTDIYDSRFGNDRAYGAAVDPVTGDLYVTGYRSNAAGDTDIYTVKYKGSPAAAPAAEILWDGDYDGLAHGEDYAVSVKITPLTHNVVVGGSTLTAAGDRDFALIMYQPEGTPVWAPRARVPLKPDSDDYAIAMDVDRSENIFLTGTIVKNNFSTDSMTLTYSTEGALRRTTIFDGAATLNDESAGITANGNGEVFVAGSSQSALGNTDLLLYKIEAERIQTPYPLIVSTSYHAATLSWPNSLSLEQGEEGGYILQRAVGACAAASDWTEVVSLPADAITYTDKGLGVGSAYCYRINSYLGPKAAPTRESATVPADAATLVPQTPGPLTVTRLDTTQVKLDWTLPSGTGHTGFIVERCTGAECTFQDGEERVVFPPVGPEAITFTDSSACAGSTYRYRITTVNRGLSLDNNGGWITRKPVTFATFQPHSYRRITIDHVAPMKADFSDLRFYDDISQQELPYWIESKTDAVSALVVVKTGVTDKAYLYYGNSAAQPAGAVAGLVAYWPFDEAAGTISGAIADKSGNGFNGSLTNSQLPNGIVAAGKFGAGLSLDGTNDYIRVTDRPNSMLDITGSFTLETWYQYAPSVGDWPRLISKPTAGNASPYHLYALLLDTASSAQRPFIEFGGAGSPKGPSLVEGNWYHLIGRYDAATGKASVFVNGVEYGQNIAPVTIGVNDETLGIGAAGTYGSPAKGTLDEVRIYNRALSDQEIVNRYSMAPSAVTLGAAEPPPNGATSFDFSPLAWQSAYIDGTSSAVMPPAPAPTLASATRISEAKIDLSWTDNSSDETGFQIERMCTAGVGCTDTDYATVAGGGLGAFAGTGSKSFSDTRLKPDWTYSYRIRALKTAACGWSGAVSGVKSASTTVSAPVVTSTTQVNTTRLDLAWADDATNLSGYRVERCQGTAATCATGSFTPVGGTSAKIYEDIAACENTDYTYRLASLFNGFTVSEGPWSMRAPVTIANFQPNFKTRLAVSYKSAMKADFSDIRFYDASAGRELSYWIESKTDGASAIVWVKTGDNNAVYLYYGNPTAMSSSNMAAVFGSGLMGYWQFEEPAGIASGTTADISGKGNHPTLSSISAPHGISAQGRYGNALSLGGDAMNALKEAVTLPTGSVMSVEAWIKPTGSSTATYNGIVSWGGRSGSNTLILAMQSDGKPSMATWGNDFVPTTGAAATANTWNHIAVVMNDKDVILYMNGQPVGTTLGILPNVTSANFIIGSTDWTSGRDFKGLIDEVRIYDRALSPQDIASSYAATLPAATVNFNSAEAAPALPGEWLGPYSSITAQSSNRTAAATPPTGLTVSWRSDSQLDLSWSDTNGDRSGARIERCADEACCRDAFCTDSQQKTVIPVTGIGTTYTDGGLTPGATYWYRVRSFKNAACGWDKGGYGPDDVKSGTVTVKAPDNVRVTPSLFTNCNDIRFADATGATVYPHWLQRSCNAADTMVTVRVPSLPAGQSPLYLYVGNPSAPNASSVADVSDLFDDFLNLSNWTTSGAVSTDGAILTVNGSAAAAATLYRGISVASPFVVDVKYQHPTVYRNRLYLTTATRTDSPTGYDYGVFDPSVNWNGFTGTTLAPDTWYTLRWENSAGNYTWRILNESGSETFSRSHGSAISGLQRFYISGTDRDLSDFKIDWLSVRRLASPPLATLLDPLKNRFPSAPYAVGGVSFLARKQFSVTNGTGSTLTAFPVDLSLDTRPLATDRITISWDDPSGSETGFSVVRCTVPDLVSSCDPESTPTWSATAGANSGATASYADTSVLPATRYCYKVKALVNGVTTAYNTAAVCANTEVPLKPSGLNATVTNSRVDLAWQDPSPALPASYIMERCKIESGGTCAFETSDATFTTFSIDHSQKTFTDPDACSGTYRYRVKSVKPWVTGWPSAYDGPVEAIVGVPVPPSALDAQPLSEGAIKLTWMDNTTDETKFEVQRCSLSTCADQDFSTVANGVRPASPGTGTVTFTDNAVTPGVIYTYRILAAKEGGCPWTVYSTPLSDALKTKTTLTAPVLTAKAVNSTRIDLSWTDTTAGETGWRVIRCTDSSCSSPTNLKTLGVGVNSYVDTTVCNSTQPYYYQVMAFKSASLSFGGGGNWTKRAKVVINDFQPDYQTRLSITIANFSGMDATLKDVRFYDATAAVELPYWIEGIADGVARVDLRTGSNNDIYVYYGNPSATATSSGVATFLLFEDFENGVTRLGGGKAVAVNSPVKSGSYAGKLSSDGTLTEDYIDLGSMTRGRVTIDYNLPHKDKQVLAPILTSSAWGADQGWVHFAADSNPYFASRVYMAYGSSDLVEIGSYTKDEWKKVELLFDTATDKYKGCVDGVCTGGEFAFVNPSADIRYLRLARTDTAGETVFFDNVRVSAYAATQPTASLGGPESSAGYSFPSNWPGENATNIASATTPALAVPVLGTVAKVSDNQINLAWTDSNADETGFLVERCADSGCTSVIKSIKTPLASSSATFSDVGLFPGTTYHYHVSAYKTQAPACGGDYVGAWSGSKSSTTDSPPPTGLSATTYGSNTVNLSWQDTTRGDTGFVVQRCDGDPCSGSFTDIGTTLSNPQPYLVRYTFDNTLQDSSESGLHLTGTTPVYEDGGIRLSTSSSFQSPMTSILDTDYYTIEFDFKMKGITPNAATWYPVFHYKPVGTDRSPGIWMENSGRAMFTWQHDNIRYSGLSGVGPANCDGYSSQFNLNTWYHIKGVKTGSNFKIYIDGSPTPVCEKNDVANPKVSGSSPLYFGGADIVLRNFTVTNDTVTKRLFTDSTVCSGKSYTYQVKALGGGLSSGGSGCWKRRAKVEYSAGSFISDYQTRLTIDRAAHPDIQPDFQDIRFYDTVASKEIPYWIENISGTVATVWIKAGGNDSIYLYYGNDAASSAANGSAVFQVFDDFDGSALDTNIWRVIDSTGFSVSNGKLHGTNTSGRLASVSTFGSDTILEAKAVTTKSALHGQLALGTQCPSNWIFEWRNTADNVVMMKEYEPLAVKALPGTSPVVYRFRLKGGSLVDGEAENYDTKALFSSASNQAAACPSTVSLSLALGGGLWSGSGEGDPRESYATDWDWVRVRRNAATEPVVAIGAAGGDGLACLVIDIAWPQEKVLLTNQVAVTMPQPVAPSGLTASVNGSDIGLSFLDNTADESGFSIERCTAGASSSCDFSTLDGGFPKTSPGNSTTFADAGLAYRMNYCYRARSFRTESCGEWRSAYADPVCARTAAAPPFNLKAEAQNSFKVKLTWEFDTAEGEAGFEVERMMPNGLWTQVGSTAANVTTFLDTAGIEPGKGYRYRVRAFYGSAGSIQPSAWSQRAFIRDIAGALLPGKDITRDLSAAPIEIVDDVNGTARITPSNGAVEMLTSSTGGGSSTNNNVSRVMIKNLQPYAGDFDVQVDYALPDGQLTSDEWIGYARLEADSGSNSATISRVIANGRNQYYGTITVNGATASASISTTDTTGKLRIRRQGDVLTLYVFSGGTWVEVANGSGASQSLTALQLLQLVRRKDQAAVRTVFSNFAGAPYTSPYSDEAAVTYTSGNTTIQTTPPFVPGASPCQ